MELLDRFRGWLERPGLIDYYNVFHQLHMLLSSGSSMQQALLDISPYQEKKPLRDALGGISRRLGAGLGIGAAFRRSSAFPTVVSPTLEAGERAGHLSAALFQLSELMYLQHNLYAKVGNALFVPKVSACMMLVMTVAYIKIAIPEFVQLYKDSGLQVPTVVGAVSGAVNAIVDYWYLTALVIYLLYRAWGFFASRNVALLDGWKLRLPIYKRLHFFFIQHQFASVTALMLASGLTVPEALSQVQKVVSNCHMADAVARARADVLKGLPLTQALQKNNGEAVFDRMLVASVNAGERSASLSRALEADCKYYERVLLNLIDPVSTKITLVVLIPLGMLIVAMYMFTMIPIFSYVGAIQ